MEQRSTILKKSKPARFFHPRKFIIDNLLNYSKSIKVVGLPLGNTLIALNN